MVCAISADTPIDGYYDGVMDYAMPLESMAVSSMTNAK